MLPKQRQSLFFSATMPVEIAKLANSILDNPTRVEVTPASSTVDKIDQSLYHVDRKDKVDLLIDLLKNKDLESVLVFARTKHGSDKIAKALNKAGVKTEAIHGNKSQNARQNALKNFKDKTTRVLIATDIAARGIDVDHLSHVFNFDLPNVPETYVHRIGRTGRAGRSGVAIAFCDREELPLLKDIHKLIKKNIPVVEQHDYLPSQTGHSSAPKPELTKGGGNRNQNQSRGGHQERNPHKTQRPQGGAKVIVKKQN